MKHDHRTRMALATAALLLALPTRADAQAPDPSDVTRKPAPAARPRKAAGPRKAPPAAKKRVPPRKRRATTKAATPRARAAGSRRAAPPRRAALPRRAEPSALQKKLRKKLSKQKKAKKKRKKTHVARMYIGADLSFFPGAHTSREVQGLGAESMPKTAGIRALHGSSLRFLQGLYIMNGAMDLRFGVGLSNLIPVGGKRALWGSDFGLGAAIRLHAFGKFDLQVYNAYRLLVLSSLDDDLNGIGLHLEVGLAVAYHINESHAVEVRLGYCRQQLRYRKDTTAQVGGLETPSGVLFKTHMIVLSFAYLHFR